MLHTIDYAAVVDACMKAVYERTETRCVIAADNVASPFYLFELTGTEPANTKTMFRETIALRIHCIAEPILPHTPEGVLSLVNALAEALTEGFELEDDMELEDIVNGGLASLVYDETDEAHAVVNYSLLVSYGFRCK